MYFGPFDLGVVLAYADRIRFPAKIEVRSGFLVRFGSPVKPEIWRAPSDNVIKNGDKRAIENMLDGMGCGKSQQSMIDD
jgi:hypothetical protein